MILWGSIDAFFLARRNLSGYFIADRGRARTFQYVLIAVGGSWLWPAWSWGEVEPVDLCEP